MFALFKSLVEKTQLRAPTECWLWKKLNHWPSTQHLLDAMNIETIAPIRMSLCVQKHSGYASAKPVSSTSSLFTV